MFFIPSIVVHDGWMELQQMRYVVAVAELGSFTRAAKRCLVVQSALSHQIARLEKELGARLFDRTSRQVRLTAAGEVFLPEARQALDAAERARAEVAATAGEVRGRLAVGAIPTVAAVDIPAALRAFHLRYPKVHIVLRDGASKDLVQEVRDGTLDVAFLGVLPSYRPKGVSDHELGTGELVAVVAPTHPWPGRRKRVSTGWRGRCSSTTPTAPRPGPSPRRRSRRWASPARWRSRSAAPTSSSGWYAADSASPCCRPPSRLS